MKLEKGYKLTEIGVVPQDWQVLKLGEIGRVIRGASPRPKGDRRFYGGTVPRLMVEDVTRDGKFVTPIVDSLTVEGAKLSRPCPKGTLTVVCSGTVGIPSFLAVDACIHDGFLALVDIKREISSDYLYHQLTSLRQKFDLAATHGGVFTNLTTTGFAEFSVAVAPSDEQRAISIALSDVDGLLTKLDQLISKKRDLKQAAMQQLLTGQTRLPDFEEKWASKCLGDIGGFLKGSGVRKDESLSGALPCIRYGEIYTQHDDYIKAFYSWISPSVASTALLLKKGDICFAGSGETKAEIGKCVAFVDDFEAYAGGDIVILRSTESNAVFMGYYLNTEPVNRQKASMGQGDAVVHISASALATIQIKVPNLDEQAAIAKVLSDIDAELATLEARREKIRLIKQGMMQELLTGRTRLI
ncbi:MAG: hypothetical protein RLZZ591_1110 [Pseudomonadota bacterium]